MSSSPELAANKARLRGYIAVWLLAVQRQADRVLRLSRQPVPPAAGADNRADVEAELVLFAVALRNLIRAVEWAADFAPAEVDAALAAFDGQVPHAVDIRDLLEHFDEYERGEGKLQRGRPRSGRRRTPAPVIGEYVYFFVHTGGPVQLQFTAGLTLDVVTAWEAGRQLGEDVLQALA